MSRLERRGASADGRFQLRARLGEGGMGVVYEAFDTELSTSVAIKTLRTLTGDALARFKHEFRVARAFAHPNIVRLGELFEQDGEWFFTMELVDGCDFLEHVRPGSTHRLAVTPGLAPDAPPAPAGQTAPGTLDEARLRDALIQLARGLGALHSAGIVHRDLKPSNVRLTRDGRLVLLDFGLVAAVDGGSRRADRVVGTAAYMAPEQAAGRGAVPASDWYAVGVMTYEALTGTLPLDGTSLEMLIAKQTGDRIARPRDVAPGVPVDLDRLCMDLLDPDPAARPGAADVLRRLGAPGPARSRAPAAHAPGGARRRRGLIGRERHLAQLAAAYANATGGDRPVVARVVGESGVGKSALVAAFLQSLGDEDGAPLVLSGRCYERERVPYKAVDALVDALADAFAGPGVDAAGIVPHHAAHLMRVFPVLRRVEAFAHAPVPAHEVRDPLELRARVFAAFRDLFERLATARPVVIAVDDLQWADDDGLALLADLVRPPDAPPLLLVATIRSGHEERTRALDAAGDVRTIYVDRLAPRDAARLARELLRDAELPVDLAADLAAEADGHPLFIDALVRHVAQSGGARARLRLDDALRARAAAQSPACRRLLDVVCVQGAPIAQRTAAAAAGVADADVQAAVDALCADKLVRSGDGPTVEPYHDRVREAVCAAMAPDRRRAIHRRLASAIEEHGGAAPERLAEHYREAGDVDRAARAAVDAARRASEALAFDRAARLYAVALSLGALPPQDARSVRIALGDALAHAARGPAAAEAYLAAADGAPPALAASLRARAADQYLKSGHIDDGLAVTRQVLATLGMKLARTPRTALWSLAWRRALLRLRGTRFAARPADAVPDAVLERIDLCWSVARGLSMVDTIRSAAFQTRHQALALRAGEPSRVVRALAIEVGHAATAGVRGQRRAERLLARAERLAIEVGAHESLGFVELAGGIAAFLVGDWRATVDRCDRALPIFRDRCVGAGWEIANARLFAIWALVFLGELAEVRRRVPAMLEDAQLRGDLYAETCAQTGLANLAWLAAGEVDDAAAHIDAAERRWSQRGFHFQHYWSMLARGNHDLYVGSPARSYRRVVEQWAGLRASQYLRIENVRVEAWHLRGRLALAAAVATHDAAARAELADAARRAARRLARERSRWAGALVHALRAGLAHASGDVDRAIVALRRAEDAASRADLRLLRQCARWRRGQLEGGDAGATLQRDAAAWLARHGVADVERMVGVWLPGFAV